MIKILIADDHELVREGLKKVLKSEMDMSIAHEAKDSVEVLKFLEKSTVDIILLDISMPGRSGLDILKDIKKFHPRLPVLILSMHAEEKYAIRALKAGASGYITKESAADELVKAIRKVVNGGKYISHSLAEQLASELITPSENLPHEALSDRELQVMCLIAQGVSVPQIAEQLSLSLSTINTYRFRVLEKMSMKTNAELIRYTLKHNLVD